MVTNPNLLVTRIFKARYFNRADIMKAGIGANPSYMWRSLLWSKNILETGLFWKVGNGESIIVSTDIWVPHLASRKITSQDASGEDLKVKDLIRENQWDSDKLNNCFLHFEVEAIMRIPIAGDRIQDKRFWRFEKRGLHDQVQLQGSLSQSLTNHFCPCCRVQHPRSSLLEKAMATKCSP